MVAYGHERNFISHLFLLFDVIHWLINEFEGIFHPRFFALFGDEENLAIATLAYEALHAVVQGRVV